MALFDFPRINFKGNADINVATINNAATFPLTIYDAVRSKPFLPPRLYFASIEIIKSVISDLNPTIHFDPLNQFYYIEILPVNTIEILRTWCMTPLCGTEQAIDIAYKPYYEKAQNEKSPIPHLPLVGQPPGYWNMYGDMGVYLSEVDAVGVQVCDQQNGEFKISNYTLESPSVPNDVFNILNTRLDFDSSPGNGISTASMCETISNQSVFAYVFCSIVNVTDRTNPDEVFLKGKPYRFSPMVYGNWKVLNWLPPMAASTRFCSAIPLDAIEGENSSPLVEFFNNNRAYDSRPLKGLFVSFTLEQVFENRYEPNRYLTKGSTPNPALSTTIGTITPWYDGDMRSGVLGRHLTSFNAQYIYEKPYQQKLTPAYSKLTPLPDGTSIFSIDMGNTWPEAMHPPFKMGEFMPTKRDQVTFSTWNLGTLSIRYGQTQNTEFVNLSIHPYVNPLHSVHAKGSIFDFHIKDATIIEAIKNNLIQVYLDEKLVMSETTYLITSDTKGLYAENGDSPLGGYISYDDQRMPCQLRIFSKGNPVTEPISILMAETRAPEAGNDPPGGPQIIKRLNLKDQDAVNLSPDQLSLTNNALYYFAYDGQYPNNEIPPFTKPNNYYTIMDTGAFVALRVHPHRDYDQYLNPENWDTTPPDWDVVYEEVFKLYDVVYPKMSEIHPWDKDIWNNGYMAGLVLQRTNMNIWAEVLYMPKTRELSEAQRQLLKAWSDYLKTQNS